MMKRNTKKSLVLILTAVLLLSTTLLVFASLDAPLPGQMELGIASISKVPVMDGAITGNEYGLSYPHIRLKAGVDYWATDASGNAMSASNVPEYIDLYLAKNGKRAYVAIRFPELNSSVGQTAAQMDAYELTTFLGFGSNASTHTENSGAKTTFRMYRKTRTVYLKEWWETEVKTLAAQAFAEDGSSLSTGRLFNTSIQVPNANDYDSVDEAAISYYPMAYWGEAKDGFATMEVELDFEDAVKASKATWDGTVPNQAYFAFDLAIFNTKSDASASCILHFNANLADKDVDEASPAATVPHILHLDEEPDADLNNTYLASLSATSTDGQYSYKVLPAVTEDRTEYELEVFDGTSAVNLTAVPATDRSQVTITGADDLSPTGNNKITVLVTSEGGISKEYTITVTWSGTITVDFYVDGTLGNDEIGTGEEAAPYLTLEKALERIATIAETTGWNEIESVRINFTGTNYSNQAGETLLFGQNTIFNKAGKKLPIMINGSGQDSAFLYLAPQNSSASLADKIACANDYTFNDITFPIGDCNTKFFAGCGEIVFKNTILSKISTGDSTLGSIYADNFTSEVMVGWSDANLAAAVNEDNKLVTSVTFGDGTVFSSSVGLTVLPNIAAVGANTTDLVNFQGATFAPADLVSSIIVDGGTVGRISARLGDSTVSHAIVEVKNGTSDRIVGDNGISSEATPRSGDITITVSGGKVNGANPSIQVLNNCILTGDININITGGEIKSTVRTAPYNGSTNSLNGSSYFNMSGGLINGGLVIGPSNTASAGSGLNNCHFKGAVVNTVSGGEIKGEICFYHNGYLKADTATNPNRQIVNNISGGTFGNLVYFGGTSGGWTHGTNCPNIINNITGGHFMGLVICGQRLGYADSITNTISNAIFDGDVIFGGPGGGSKLVLTTTINSGTFNGKLFCATSSGKVTTNFKGGTFNGEVFASGSTLKSTSVSSITSGSTITTNISGGTFAAFYGGTATAADYEAALAAMGNKGTITISAYTINIKNTITGGKFTAFYGGSKDGELITGTITNIVSGTSATNFYGANKLGTHNGNISNTFKSGTRSGTFYGGAEGGTVVGNITNSVTDGTFSGRFNGGNLYGVVDGNISNTVTGGTFNNNFSGSSRGSNGTGHTSVVTGNVSTLIEGKVTFGSNVIFSGGSCDNFPNVVQGQIINTIRSSGSKSPTFGTNSFSAYLGGYRTAIGKGIINNISAGYFPKAVFGGTRTTTDGGIGADPETGYSVVNNISGGTFNPDHLGIPFHGGGWSDTVEKPMGKIHNNISGGEFYGFCAGLRTPSSPSDITNTISGGTFHSNNSYDTAIGGFSIYLGSLGHNDSQAKNYPIKSVVSTISGGTFEGNVIVGNKGAGVITDTAKLTVTGGTFQKNIYVGSAEASNTDKIATLILHPTAADITLQGSIVVRNTTFDSLQLKGGSYKLLLDADAAFAATSYDGNALTVQQTEQWAVGTVYVTIPVANAANITVEKKDGNVSGYACMITNNTTAQLTGIAGAEVTAASLILNESINVRFWIRKDMADAIGNDLTFTIKRADLADALMTVTYADLIAGETKVIDGIECYTVILPATAPSAFHVNISVSGTGITEFTGSINDILALVTANQGGTYSDGFVHLAKTLWNYGIEAYERFVGEESLLVPEEIADPQTVPVSSFINNNGDGSVILAGKSLVLREAVGIKLYAKINTDPANLKVVVNGKELSADQYEFKSVTGSDSYNASITIFFKASKMATDFEVSIYNGEAFAATLCDSIASCCQQYINAAGRDAELCKAILAYIQAIPGAEA